MMDYYSNFDMPSADKRKADLKEYAKTLNYTFTDSELDAIIQSTPEYSLTGYNVFGRSEEQAKLRKLMKK